MTTQALNLSESLGDYIECIYHLVQARKVARVKEIAARMGVHMSSVTGALRSLAEKQLVNYDPYSLVTLTPHGEEAARDLVRRHEVLSQFMSNVLSVDAQTAGRNACHMEHSIEPEVMEKLVTFLQFLEECPGVRACWKRGLDRTCGRGTNAEECRRCAGQMLPAT
jgi:DtxR family Mn-dependent transcriptional regulator